MKKPKRKLKVSVISELNIFRLVYRGALLLLAIAGYVVCRIFGINFFVDAPYKYFALGILVVITVLLLVEMLERFAPDKYSSPGSQKQFEVNYIPSGETTPELMPWWRTMIVIISWVVLNGIFYVLYFLGIFPPGIMMIIGLFYAISDMICILFFCPFQTWMMKNRCCSVCRIYNWDFLMMSTPFLPLMSPYVFNVVPNSPFFDGTGWQMVPGYFLFVGFTSILFLVSLVLFIRWEITYKKHPERFSDKTNMSIRCVNCREKLCQHKTQLQKMLLKSHTAIFGQMKDYKAQEEQRQKEEAEAAKAKEAESK